MKQTADFTFLRHEQSNDDAWTAFNAFALKWNDEHEPKLSSTMDFLWTINFRDKDDPAYAEFTSALLALKHSHEINYRVTSQVLRDAADYRAADFVEILGVSLEGFPNQPFIVNERQALGQPVPCPECGWQDMFSAPQKAPFEIDEILLDSPLPGGGNKPVGGWDCVNLPNGHKLISQRIVTALVKLKVKGYELLPVRVAGSGKESRRMFQLLARRIIVVLQSSQQKDDENVFCGTCGTVRSLLPGHDTSALAQKFDYCLEKKDLGSDELFSRHPGHGAMIYVAQRVYKLLLDEQLNGVVPNDAIKFCRP